MFLSGRRQDTASPPVVPLQDQMCIRDRLKFNQRMKVNFKIGEESSLFHGVAPVSYTHLASVINLPHYQRAEDQIKRSLVY